MWKRVSATWGNRVSPHSIDSSWSCWRSFLCGNGSFPHGNDFIPPGNDSIPHRNEPKPTVGGWKPIRSRSNRHGNDRKPHGGAAKANKVCGEINGFREKRGAKREHRHQTRFFNQLMFGISPRRLDFGIFLFRAGTKKFLYGHFTSSARHRPRRRMCRPRPVQIFLAAELSASLGGEYRASHQVQFLVR